MFNNKGLVSITTFSLLIFLFIAILSFSFIFYNNSKVDFDSDINEKEIIESLHKLRSELIVISSKVNSSLNYTDEYARESLRVELKGTNLTGTLNTEKISSQKTLTLYGLEFCSTKNISLAVQSSYQFNGTCIIVN